MNKPVTPGPGATENLPLIAVVEDDAMQLVAIRMLLETWGYAVVAASSASAIEAALGTAGRLPDLVVTDFRLPGNVYGTELVERLRQRAGRAVPAVLVTGDTAPDLIEEAARRHIALLHKPYHPDALRRALADGLGPIPRPGRPSLSPPATPGV